VTRVRTRGLLVSAFTGRMPSLAGRADTWPRWILTVPAAVVVLALAPGVVLVAGVGWLALRFRPDRLVAWVAAAVGSALAVLVVLIGGYTAAWSSVVQGQATARDWVVLVVWSVLLGLPTGPLFWRADAAHRERQPMGGPTERERREAAEAERRRRVVHALQGLPVLRVWASWLAVPDASAVGPLLGVQLRGDLRWPSGPRGSVVVPRPPEVQHVAVLGATGSGKSEVVWRLVEDDVRAGGGARQVIYLNCKQPGHGGSPSARLAGLAHEAGRSFRVLAPGRAPWDPMRGTPQRVHQRLMAAEEWSEPWDQHLASVVLGLALELARREERSPESLGELVQDLLRGGLADLAEDDPRAAEALATIEKKDDQGLLTRLMDQAMQLSGWIGPVGAGGWSWEDADVIAVDLPTSTDPGAARMLLRLMLTDIEGWITEERRPMRAPGRAVPLTLVLEEVSALDGDPILARRVNNLMERARSSEARVIVVAQGPSGLGDERTQEAIMTNSTVVTGRQATTAVVETIAGLAGTRVREEASVSYEQGADQIRGSIRAQHGYAVDPNMLRSLSRGEVVVIDRGRWAQVAVTMTSAGYRRPGTTRVPEVTA
jgi:hypothetical protein